MRTTEVRQPIGGVYLRAAILGLSLLLGACGGGGGADPGGGTSVGAPGTLGPAGGSLRLGNITLAVPAGALGAEVVFSATTDPAAPAGSLEAYRILPEGTTFLAPVTITIAYDDTQGYDPATFALGTLEDGAWRRVPGSAPLGQAVRGTTTHLSVYGVLPRENTPPILTAPADVVAEATGPTSSPALGTPSVVDESDTGLVATASPSGGFGLGIHTVTWEVTDADDNMARATQRVEIFDSTPPQVTAPGPVVAEATGPLTDVALGTAGAHDLVDGALTPRVDPAGPYGVGNHTLTWRATDSSGNQGEAVQAITVRDTTAPTLQNLPADMAVEVQGAAFAAIDFTLPTVTDTVDPAPIVMCSPYPGAPFPVGLTTVTCNGRDASGNQTTATFDVLVRDIQPQDTQVAVSGAVTGPLKPGVTVQVVSYSDEGMDPAGFTTTVADSRLSRLGVLDDSGRLVYMALYSPQGGAASLLNGLSTATALLYRTLVSSPLPLADATDLLSRIAAHPDTVALGQRVEAIVAAAGYFDPAQLTVEDQAAMVRVLDDVTAALGAPPAGAAAKPVLGRNLTASAGQVQIPDVLFSEKAGPGIDTTITVANKSFLAYAGSVSLGGATLPLAYHLPPAKAANALELFLNDSIAIPAQAQFDYALADRPTDVVRVTFDPAADPETMLINVLLFVVNATDLAGVPGLEGVGNDLLNPIGTSAVQEALDFYIANGLTNDGKTIASVLTDPALLKKTALELAKRFLKDFASAQGVGATAIAFYEATFDLATKAIWDMPKFFGLRQQMEELWNAQPHPFDIRAANNRVVVNGIGTDAAEVFWTPEFGPESAAYEVTLWSADANGDPFLPLRSAVAPHSSGALFQHHILDMLEPSRDYFVSVVEEEVAPVGAGSIGATLERGYNLVPFTTLALPDIVVGLNGTPLAPLALGQQSHYDFGSLGPGQAATPITVNIWNQGGSDLSLGQVTSANDSPHFTFTQPGTTMLAPNASASFEVNFSPQPQLPGVVGTLLWIPSNDPDMPTFGVAVSGTIYFQTAWYYAGVSDVSSSIAATVAVLTSDTITYEVVTSSGVYAGTAVMSAPTGSVSMVSGHEQFSSLVTRWGDSCTYVQGVPAESAYQAYEMTVTDEVTIGTGGGTMVRTFSYQALDPILPCTGIAPLILTFDLSPS